MLRVAIVEDDAGYANQLTEFLDRYGTENGKEIHSTIFRDGLDIVEDYQPAWDIILLDIEMPLLDGMSAAERSTASLMIHTEGGTRKLLVSSIRYIEVADHRLIYHSTEGDFEMFGSLKELEATLGKDFARCNHCYLVHLKYVDGIQADNVILGQDTLKISRTKKKEFVQRVSDYYRFGGR